MEHLPSLVNRICHQFLLRMPSWIDTRRQRAGSLEVHLRHLSVIYEHSTAIILPYMKLGVSLPVVVLRHMTVYTLSVVTFAMHTVAVEHTLVEGGHVTLAEHHILIVHVRRFDESVG